MADAPSLRLLQPSAWRLAIYASLGLWLVMAVGNVALFAVRPPHHWPLLESAEALQIASVLPIALLLHRVNHRSPTSRAVTGLGIIAMAGIMVIDLAFATGAAAFGVGLLGGPVFVVAYLVVLIWLLAANCLAWRAETLPRGLAGLGVATALTATLLYPAWAI